MKIKVYVQTNYVGSRDECEIDVDDNATEDEIEAIAKETMWEMMEWGWVRCSSAS